MKLPDNEYRYGKIITLIADLQTTDIANYKETE